MRRGKKSAKPKFVRFSMDFCRYFLFFYFPRLSFPFIFPSAIISFPFYVYEILQYMYVPFLHYWWFYHSLSWSSPLPPLLHQCRHPSRCPSAATERSFQSLTCLYKYTPSPPPPSKPHCALITIAHRETWGGE